MSAHDRASESILDTIGNTPLVRMRALLESSSGNTGIGLAMVGAVKG
jgi:cysteine synthase